MGEVELQEDDAKAAKAHVFAQLRDHGVRAEVAKEYADLYVEYREAAANIDRNGTICQHPRTSNPITNPYLPIRDACLKKMKALKVRAPYLWE